MAFYLAGEITQDALAALYLVSFTNPLASGSEVVSMVSMVSIDVDGQICHFWSQGFVP